MLFFNFGKFSAISLQILLLPHPFLLPFWDTGHIYFRLSCHTLYASDAVFYASQLLLSLFFSLDCFLLCSSVSLFSRVYFSVKVLCWVLSFSYSVFLKLPFISVLEFLHFHTFQFCFLECINCSYILKPDNSSIWVNCSLFSLQMFCLGSWYDQVILHLKLGTSVWIFQELGIMFSSCRESTPYPRASSREADHFSPVRVCFSS